MSETCCGNNVLSIPGVGEFKLEGPEPFRRLTSFHLVAVNPNFHDRLVVPDWGPDIHNENGFCHLDPIPRCYFRQLISWGRLPADTIILDDATSRDGLREQLLVFCGQIEANYLDYRWQRPFDENPESFTASLLAPTDGHENASLDEWLETFRQKAEASIAPIQTTTRYLGTIDLPGIGYFGAVEHTILPVGTATIKLSMMAARLTGLLYIGGNPHCLLQEHGTCLTGPHPTCELCQIFTYGTASMAASRERSDFGQENGIRGSLMDLAQVLGTTIKYLYDARHETFAIELPVPWGTSADIILAEFRQALAG